MLLHGFPILNNGTSTSEDQPDGLLNVSIEGASLSSHIANAQTIHGRGLDELRTKLEVLRGHCQALNRPCEHLQKTTLFMAPVAHDGHLDPAALDYIRALGELGVEVR